MKEQEERLWQTKLAARLHDPAEKALILMRTAQGHEFGTSRRLRERLGLVEPPAAVVEAVRRADHWASAADRAAFPNRDRDGRYPAWQRVRFDERPVIIHPLTGKDFDLGELRDLTPQQAEAMSYRHFSGLIHDGDLRKSALAFWRFGPEISDPEVKNLWPLLPADTRVPDHTIFDHLDLTAALAGCFALDPEEGPALLAVSLGPVQDFIAAARTTSDLWAGSHLLSRLSWEAMRVVCEELGPEAILFPRLRGVPQVDLWLRQSEQLDPALFEACAWADRATDANPLFAAALPNRFTALVPAGQARELAEKITERVRQWVIERADEAFRGLLKVAPIPDAPDLHGYRQIREQLAGFPEVHWAAVPWSLVGTDGEGKVAAGDRRLAEAMRPYFSGDPPGYLGSQAWRLLGGGVDLEDGWFWKPNPGALYPALHEMLERHLAANKAVRPFAQTRQHGWRDSLSGEAEWLTHRQEDLRLPPGRRDDTLWALVAGNRPAWAKKREHLSALGALKRLWPDLFAWEVADALGLERLDRFVVSTHTMALAPSLVEAIGQNRVLPDGLVQALERSSAGAAALPRKLAEETLRDHPYRKWLKRLPAWLGAVAESDDEVESRRSERLVEKYLRHKPEAYYGLLLMDGDKMGAWLSAEGDLTRPHQESYHPQIRAGLQALGGDSAFTTYAGEPRPPSPSRHMAISEALNHFALTLAPTVVERHYGRVLYAGGDDLMAMAPVAELLPVMAALRAAYAGVEPWEMGLADGDAGFQRQGSGFVRHRGRLMRVMGEQATASCGAVVAHHQAPLGAVLRELRAAERRAKEEGGRNAFSLTIVKRSGGTLRLTARWGEALRHLARLRAFLAEPEVSRRAAYNSVAWLRDLPEPDGEGGMAAHLLAYQLRRQAGRKVNRDHYDLPGLARGIVQAALGQAPFGERLGWIENFLSVAEFLARETRGATGTNEQIAREAHA